MGAPFGDAFLAGVGVKMFKDSKDIKRLVEITEKTEPNPKLGDLYSKFYRIYRDLYEHNSNDAYALYGITPFLK